jgi:hypothetical protein
MDACDEPLRLNGMADAASAAFGVRRRFRRGHCAAVLDAHGLVLDLTVFTRRHHSIDTAVAWAGCVAVNDGRADRVILYSAMKDGVADELREADIETLRRARRELGEAGVLVVDWLQCDGKHVRSIDFASDGEGWHRAASVA